ncbi:MAG: PIG-L family deacetylase [Actinobacteria bacterium]|nr:PIG-L family deacetylase [Actinomycetota bacterium]MBU1944860.1 PIG-L family deacetylase [Actinomycetota bacterium]MBU2688556.1 PIG-L family deacetylase [Actinomycetota bacterium]
MAGTLLMLAEAGADVHIWSLSDGRYGSRWGEAEETARVRRTEAIESASLAGATWHPPLFEDLGLVYHPEHVRLVSSVIRQVRPNVLLVPSAFDYTEDHREASRLLVTAAFTREIGSYPAEPVAPPSDEAVAVYHALPYGLRDQYGRPQRPGLFVDIAPVFERKKVMLARHRSQEEWLEQSQGTSPLECMEAMSLEAGRLSGCFERAEGWNRHNPLGLSPETYTPLEEALGDACAHVDR